MNDRALDRERLIANLRYDVTDAMSKDGLPSMASFLIAFDWPDPPEWHLFMWQMGGGAAPFMKFPPITRMT